MGASPCQGVFPPGEILNNATGKVKYVTMVWPVLEVGHSKSEIAFNIKNYPIFKEQNPTKSKKNVENIER